MNGHLDRRVSERTGRVSYRVVVYVDKAHGGPRYEFPGSYALEREATAKLVAVLATYQDGTPQRPSSLTVRELVARWIRDSVEVDKAANTIAHHRSNARLHIDPFLGDHPAATLQPAEVAAWQAAELKAGCATKSVLNYRATLHAAYAWAVLLKLLPANPVASVPAPRLKREKPAPPAIAEVRAFVAKLEDTRLWAPVMLAAATGMRRGEVLALRWSDIDLATGVVHIHPDRGNLTGRTVAELAFGPPKTEAGKRDVALPPFACELLIGYRAGQSAHCLLAGLEWTDKRLVCCGGDGQPIVPDGLTTELSRFRHRHGLERIHIHLLRHAVATAMLEAGVRLDVVSEHLGHKDTVTTSGVYGYVRPAAKKAAAEVYGSLWSAPEAEIQHQMNTKSGAGDELAVRRARRMPA